MHRRTSPRRWPSDTARWQTFRPPSALPSQAPSQKRNKTMSEDSTHGEETKTTEVRSLDEQHDASDGHTRVEVETTTSSSRRPPRNRNVVIVAVAAIAALVVVLALLMWSRGNKAEGESVKATVEAGEHKDEHGAGPGREVGV